MARTAAAVAAARALPAADIGSRGLAANFLLLAAGEIAAKLLTFLAFSYLARALGPIRYGNLEFALAALVFFTLPVDLGLGAYGAREIARHRDRAAALLSEITTIRFLLALGSYAVLLGFAMLIHKAGEVKWLLAFLGISLLGGPFLTQWFFQGHDQMRWVAMASVVRQTTYALMVFAVVRRYTPVHYLGLLECVAVAATGLFCLAIVVRHFGFHPPRLCLSPSILWAHLRHAAPIGLTEVTWAFTWYFATVLLGLMVVGRPLGWFGASHRALMALHTFVWLYFFNLLPSISRCVSQPRGNLLYLMDRSLRLAAWAAGLLILGLTLLAHQVITIVYGWAFAPAAGIFSILIWMLPISMIAGHYRYTLIAYNQQNRLLVCTLTSATVAVVLGFLLISRFGAHGAAWTLVCANLVNFALMYLCVISYVAPIHFHGHLVRPLLTAALLLAGVRLLHIPNAWAAAIPACSIYAAFFLLREFTTIRVLLPTVLIPAARRSQP